MDYQRYEIRKINPQSDEYTIFLYIADHLSEFANELGTIPREKKDVITLAQQIVREKYPNLKVTMVKVIIGGLAITSIPLLEGKSAKAEAAEPTITASQDIQTGSIYYNVGQGDTLWSLSKKFNTTIDTIKKANNLTSDILRINQQLIIPKAFHTVETGDYLTVLAKKYGTTVEAIKAANGLTSDSTRLGQTLIIPNMIGVQISQPVPSAQTPAPSNENNAIKYTVVSGDTLSAIAKRFGTTVDALRGSNNLSSDLLRVGQLLTIPTNGTNSSSPVTVTKPLEQAITSNNTSSYTVISGDTLGGIAKKYSISVDSIKQANQLTSDVIRVGQVLTIPNGQLVTDVKTPSAPSVSGYIEKIQKNLQTLGYYTVPTMTGSYDTPTKQAVSNFQEDYGIPVTGTVDDVTSIAIDHAIVKKELVADTINYLGVPYLWGGTTPSGFDCSGFVYYMFNKHGVDMNRNTSGGLYKIGTPVDRASLQPGDLVFFAVNTTGTISHVGFYMGDNQFISATNSKGMAVYSMDHTYWGKYYTGAKRVY